jgi:hypothetical protein
VLQLLRAQEVCKVVWPVVGYNHVVDAIRDAKMGGSHSSGEWCCSGRV